MKGAAWPGLDPALIAILSDRVRAPAREKLRCVRNATRAAAKFSKVTRRASLSSITIARRCSGGRSITWMASSATKFISGAHSCRARCTRTASPAATATTRTAASCAPRETLSVLRAIWTPNTIHRRTTITSLTAPVPHEKTGVNEDLGLHRIANPEIKFALAEVFREEFSMGASKGCFRS